MVAAMLQVASELERLLGAPAIMIPMGQSSDNCHLANERIRRSNLFRGKAVIRNLLEEVGRMAAAAKEHERAAAAAAAAVQGQGQGQGITGSSPSAALDAFLENF